MITTAGIIVINGVSITTDGTETLGRILDKINSLSSVTGVVAEYNDSTRVVTLRATEYGSNFRVDVSDSANVLGLQSATVTAGQDARATVTVKDVNGNDITVYFTKGGIGKTSGLRLSDARGNVILLKERGNVDDNTAYAVARTTAGDVNLPDWRERGSNCPDLHQQHKRQPAGYRRRGRQEPCRHRCRSKRRRRSGSENHRRRFSRSPNCAAI